MQVAGNAVLSALGSGQQWRMALALSETEAWEGMKRAMGIYGISMDILLDPCFIRRFDVEGSLFFSAYVVQTCSKHVTFSVCHHTSVNIVLVIRIEDPRSKRRMICWSLAPTS
jgi:hypothetical protein